MTPGMIIEFVGLPGAGKSALIGVLKKTKTVSTLEISPLSLLLWSKLGAFRHPVAALHTMRRIMRSPASLRRYGLINSLLYPLAAYALRKRRTIAMEHGFLQGLVSFPSKGALTSLPLPDLIVIVEASKSVRDARLQKRGWTPRSEFGAGEAERFAAESEAAFPALKKEILEWAGERAIVINGESDIETNRAILERCITRGGIYIHRPIRNAIKTAVYLAAYIIRTILRVFDRRAEVAVLMYHAIDRSSWKLSIDPQEFEWQVRQIKDCAVPLEAIVRHAKGESVLKKNAVALTFDDAYLDFKTNALPILEKYNVPATVFVPTDLTGEIHPMRTGLMTWEDMRGIQKKGLVTFESHSRTHPHLPKVNAAELKDELEGSAAELARELGRRTLYHAYPYGDKNKEVIEATKAANYEAAFGITQGMINPGDNLFTLKRIQVDKSMNRALFRMRLTRAVDIHRSFLSRLHLDI